MPSAFASRVFSMRTGSTGDADFPLVGRVDAGQHLDQGRLAGAVVAEERHDLTREQVDIDVLERVHATEGLRDAPKLHEGRRHRRLRW